MKNKIEKYLVKSFFNVFSFCVASSITGIFVFFAYGLLPETLKFFRFEVFDYIQIGSAIKLIQMAISLNVKMDSTYEEE